MRKLHAWQHETSRKPTFMRTTKHAQTAPETSFRNQNSA